VACRARASSRAVAASRGGGGLAGVGDEQLPLLREEGLLLGVDGAELAIVASGRGDVGDQPGAQVLRRLAPDQSLAKGGCTLLGEALVMDLQRRRLGRSGGQQVAGGAHGM